MSVWGQSARVVIFVTNSLGEIDFLTPVIERERKNLKSLTMVFTDVHVYKKFLSSGFYSRYYSENNFVIVSPEHLQFTRILEMIIRSDVVMFEQSGGGKIGKMVSLIAVLLRKQILIHPHATNVEVGSFAKLRSILVTSHPILLSTEILKPVYEAQGFHRFVKVGFPKYYPEWMKRFLTNEPKDSLLIFSRPKNEIWMPGSLYEDLMTEAVQEAREVFGHLPVIIKVHPREDRRHLELLLQERGWRDVLISEENSLMLCQRAKVAIGFFTSAIFDSYGFGIPSIDYYREPQSMKNAYPDGRSNTILKLDTAETPMQLRNFLIKVRDGQYSLPQLISQLKAGN